MWADYHVSGTSGGIARAAMSLSRIDRGMLKWLIVPAHHRRQLMKAIFALYLPVAITFLFACNGEPQPGQRGPAATADPTKESDGLASVQDASEATFWAALRLDANWVEYFATLEELVTNADVIVHGQLTAVEAGKETQGDAPEDAVSEGSFSVDVENGWRGASNGDVFVFNLVLNTPLAELQQMRLPAGDVVVFARRRSDGGGYRLVNGYGLWTATERASVDVPVNELPATESPYAADLTEVSTFEQFVLLVQTEALR